MKIEFLISTTNRTNTIFLNSIFSEVDEDDYHILIINQCIDIPLTEITCNDPKIRCISSIEKGISKSRNMAIRNSIGDICVISDDDVVFDKNVVKTIKNRFLSSNSVVNLFKIQTPEGFPYKKYSNHNYYLTKNYNIMQVSSIEITFLKENIIKNNLFFNENLGLGTELNGGEEICFLKDCMNKKIKISFCNEYIVKHPIESSGKNFANKNNAMWNGAVLKKLYPIAYFPLIIYFSLKRRKYYKSKYSLIKYIRFMLQGSSYINH